jgi:hypothetical protein
MPGRITSPLVVPVVYTLASVPSVQKTIVSRRESHLSLSRIWLPAAFRKILESNEPSSIVAIPEYNKFLVHCESTLSSYPLDKVIRASRAVQGDAAIKDLGDSEEKLSKDEEHVLFLKAGRLLERTAVPNRTIDRIVGK